MNYPSFEFSRQCMKCKIMLDLDDYAIDTKTCENNMFFSSSVLNAAMRKMLNPT